MWKQQFLHAKMVSECRGDHFAPILSSGRCENDVFWCVLVFVYMFYMFLYVFSSKTTYFAHFEAPGILKTAPACIFHHNWYGKTYISMIFDHIHSILHHICCIFYHLYGISYNKMRPRGGDPAMGERGFEMSPNPGVLFI